MSSMTRSAGGVSPGNSISGLVVLGSKPMVVTPFGRWWSAGVEQVDDEDQGVGALDPGARLALGAVAVGRGDDHEQAAADALADDVLVPGGDELADADRELGVALLGLGRAVEHLPQRPDVRQLVV